mmetsp:Transcript_19341/g.27004  ORF Transcript_19341/g.27004 Transcript_19341/m.27004 type:complete len:144 (+) Transcript_19341:215-646(+)
MRHRLHERTSDLSYKCDSKNFIAFGDDNHPRQMFWVPCLCVPFRLCPIVNLDCLAFARGSAPSNEEVRERTTTDELDVLGTFHFGSMVLLILENKDPKPACPPATLPVALENPKGPEPVLFDCRDRNEENPFRPGAEPIAAPA